MNKEDKFFILIAQEYWYLSTKFQGSKKRFYEICYCCMIDYTFVQSQFFQWQGLATLL